MSPQISSRKIVAFVLLFLLLGGAFSQGLFGKNGYFRAVTNRHSNTTTGVLWPASTDPRGSCIQCHTGHAGGNDFGLRATNDDSFCFTCHAGSYQRSWTGSTNYNASAHGLSVLTYHPDTGAGSGRQVKLCVQCHNPHGNGDATNGFRLSLQEYLEQNTCFSNNSAGTAGNGCHGQNAAFRPTNAKDIYTQFQKATVHPLALGDPNTTRRHSANEAQSIGWNPASSRHVECADCHNPHRARAGTHLPPTNVLSNVLLGTWGVEPTWPGAWSSVTSYTVKNFINDPPLSSEHEYQLCLKCHSYYAYTTLPPTGYTDQALEFNKNNPSYHIIGQTTTRSANMYNVPNAGFNRTIYNWTSSSSLYCADCHSENTTTATLATTKGPHGSNNNKLTWGSYTGNTGGPGTENDICFKCHAWGLYVSGTVSYTYSGFRGSWGWSRRNLHSLHVNSRGARCMNCHVKIPHGWKRPHLISQRGDRAAYPLYFGTAAGNFPGVWINITTWKSSGSWSSSNCDHSGC